MILLQYSVGGLFSGAGGIELGFQRAGFKISWANDNDPYCNQTYQTNFKHRLISEDIRNLDPNDLEPVDLLVAGFPCQPFSQAGKRTFGKSEPSLCKLSFSFSLQHFFLGKK